MTYIMDKGRALTKEEIEEVTKKITHISKIRTCISGQSVFLPSERTKGLGRRRESVDKLR